MSSVGLERLGGDGDVARASRMMEKSGWMDRLVVKMYLDKGSQELMPMLSQKWYLFYEGPVKNGTFEMY